MSKKKKDKQLKKLKVSRQSHVTTGSIWKDKKLLFPILFILAFTFVLFSPSLSNQFVNWDDDVNLLENEQVRSLSADNIKSIFSSDVIGNYNPLPILTFAIEYAMVGYKPFLYHLNNLLLHLLVVFLVYQLTLKLKVDRIVAIISALLFAIHPMRVESVAWVTERKDVLFAAFFFAALIYYIKYLEDKKNKKYLVFIYLFFILSLFSKIQAVALPLSMLAIDYWRDRKIGWSLIIEKIPYFILSLIFGLIGIYMLSENQSLDQTKANYSFAQRLCIGGYSYLIYWYKLIFPYPLSPLYPYPKSLPWYIYAAPIPALAIIASMVYGYLKKWKAYVFGTAWFTLNIVFLLQILGAGQGFLADRFTYVAYYGLFFSIGYYVNKYFISIPKRKNVGFASMGILLILFSISTFQQIKVWENGDTLWTHVLKHYSKVDTPFRNRGNYHRDSGDYVKAMQDYQALIKIDSTNGPVYNSMGKVFFEQKNWEQALFYYNKAVKFSPEKGEFWVNRAATKASMGNMRDALEDVSIGIERDPAHLNGYQTRFLIQQYLNNYEASLFDLNKLIEYKPKDSGPRYEKGRVHLVLGRPAEAIKYFNEAINLDPNQGLYYKERAKAYLATGNKQGAAADFNKAQQLGLQIEAELLNQVR